jgi:hypothetical protein
MGSRKFNRTRRWVARAALLTLAVAPATAATEVTDASPAGATASGCSYWGAALIGKIPVAKGQDCVTIAGQGTFVSYVRSAFGSVGNVCNWNTTAEFFDINGKWYQTFSSPVRKSCTRSSTDQITLNRYVRSGRMCSTLKTNGSRITSVCHNIHP